MKRHNDSTLSCESYQQNATMVRSMSQDFQPLVRRDTGATLTYDSYEQGSPKLIAHTKTKGQNIADKKRFKDSNLDLPKFFSNGRGQSVKGSTADLLELGEATSDAEGVLFFPSMNNKGYAVRPISGHVLSQHLNAAMGKPVTFDEEIVFKIKNKSIRCDSLLKKRFITMFEVIVAKMWLAGFMWQSIATLSGLSPTTFQFAITAGVGEAIGVWFGNCFYDIFKKMMYDDSINIMESVQTGILLATATACSGTAWQPIVNTLQKLDLSFYEVFWITGVACTFCFNFGLRVARTLFSERLSYIEESTYENGKMDMSLSIAIGAATAFFVGTDTGNYTPEENFLYYVVGMTEDMSPLGAAYYAGCSTVLGFFVAQSVFNVIYPYGKCWID